MNRYNYQQQQEEERFRAYANKKSMGYKIFSFGLGFLASIFVEGIPGVGTLFRGFLNNNIEDSTKIDLVEEFNIQTYGDEYGIDFASWEDYYKWKEFSGIPVFYETDSGDLGTVTALIEAEQLHDAFNDLKILYSEGLLELPYPDETVFDFVEGIIE